MRNEFKIVIIGALSYYLLKNRNEIGKIYDYQARPKGRVDKEWGQIIPNSSYVGRYVNNSKWLSPEQVVKEFGLYGIEFGNWVNQEERANMLFATAVSLNDLAKVIGWQNNKIGFRKRLAIALGARGMGGKARAFYQGNPYFVINLTKPHGHKTLAHEYGHAIDNFIGKKRTGKEIYISGGHSIRIHPVYSDKKKGTPEYHSEKFFDLLFWDDKGRPTSFLKRLEKLPNYWRRRTEVFARTFDLWVQKQLRKKRINNNFLAGASPMVPDLELLRKAEPHLKALINYARK